MSDNSFRKGPHGAKNKSFGKDVEIAETASVPTSDERKTVILDEDLDGVEFEDRVWLYWNRNKNFIILTVVAAFIIILGVQGGKMYMAAKQQTLSSAYEAAATPEELAAFAAANKGTPLAGVALLGNADDLYSAGKFDEASKLYAQAEGDLSETILYGRAKLGSAVSLYSVDAAKGEDALKKIFESADIAASYKAQAGFLLGLAYKQAGKLDEAKNILQKVSDLHGNGIFGRIAQETLSQMR